MDAERGSVAAVVEALERERVACGPVLSPADAMRHPHFLERGSVRLVDDPLVGPIAVPGFPIVSSEPLQNRTLVAPALGEHNRQVLVQELGITTSAFDGIVTRGILVEKPY